MFILQRVLSVPIFGRLTCKHPPPAQRFATAITGNSITVNATTAPFGWTTQYRRRLAPNGAWSPWQNSNTFTGLAANTDHHAQARFTANNTNTHAHSGESVVSTNIRTSNAQTPILNPTPSAWTDAPAHASSKVITVSSSGTWTVSRNNNANWLILSPTQGTNGSSFTIRTQANAVASTRTAIVTVSSNGLTKFFKGVF